MEALKILISGTPLFISTIINHFVSGPPQPSWDILSHLTFATSKLLIKHARNLTVEIIQRNCIKGFALPGAFKEEEIIIPNQFRKNAQPYLEKIIKGYEHLISDRWRQFEDDDKILSAKWIYAKKQGLNRNQDDLKVILFLHGGGYILGSADSHRLITTKLATSTNALVLAINYRLAPQNQFPAGLHDAISAYLYLTNPPEDASFKPIDPKRIVIMGDSAGGGLTIATLLALRDSELPMVAGAVCFSPWVDLNHSMPSVIDPRNELTDYLPRLGLNLKPSPAYNEYIKECEKLSKLIKVETGTTFRGAPFNLNKIIQLYTLNEAMGIPYVSPLCAESLAGLPPMLIQAGDGERLRDESIYFSFKASQPQKYQLPVYNAGKFEQSPFKTPTNIALEIYEDMPHAFQMIFYFSKPAQIAFQRIGEFTEKLISHATSSPISTSPNDLLPSLDFTKSTYTLVTVQGKTLPLSDEHMKVLEWTEVGKVPPINRPQEETVTNLNIHPLIYLVMVMAMLMFFVI